MPSKTPQKKSKAAPAKAQKAAKAKPAAAEKKCSKAKPSAAKVSVSAKKKPAAKIAVSAPKDKKGAAKKGVSVKIEVKQPQPALTIKAQKKAAPKQAEEQPVVSDRPSHHIAFTLSDLDAYFKDVANNVRPKLAKSETETSAPKSVQQQVKKQPKGAIKLENKSQGVATIFDILGFNPVETPSVEKREERDVPRKWKKYYSLLVDLRKRYSSGVASRSEEGMKRSAKDDSGDLSSYGQHLADAGSGSFERDLAYNMISNQTEILSEIEAAISRIKNGTYGVCEVTGKPIPEKRLEAIPFTRYTREGQEIHEREQKRTKSVRRENVFDMGMDSSSSQQPAEDEESESPM